MTDARPWPAAAIEMAPLEALAPFAGNARTHPPKQIEAIAALMLRFGFTVPVLRDEAGTIIAGHARLKAATLNRDRGHAQFAMVPVMTASGWSDAERRAYTLADNQSALLAGWDFGMLATEMQALAGAAFDMSMLAFSETDMRRLAGYAAGLTDADAIPELPKEAVSHAGDLWLLGQHRLLCGDSTKAEDVARVLGDLRPNLMVTDPPFGVNYDPAWRARAGVNLNKAKLGKVANDDRADWREAWALFAGNVAYIWHGGLHAATVEASLEACGFSIRSQIIWAKDRFALGRGDYHWQHEPCWYAVREGAKGGWSGDRKQVTLWTIPARDDGGHGHGTQKPVECMRRPMENSSRPGDVVYEPFCGSGTSVISAEQTARVCCAIEIDPRYVDVIVQRWQNFTGKQATLSGTTATFEEISEQRRQKSHGRTRTKAAADGAAGAGG